MKRLRLTSVPILLLAAVALAALLRFYRLHQLPPGLWFDEAWISVAARDSAAAGTHPVYFAAPFGGMHPAVVYLTRLARGLLPGNLLAIRYALAVIGTLTVPLTYFTLKVTFQLDTPPRSPLPALRSTLYPPRFIPLLGTFILAITFPFLLFSRLGFESMLPAPASALVFLSLALALRQRRHGRRGHGLFILTGLLLGLSLYTFDTARFLPIALTLAYWSYTLVHDRRPGPTTLFPFFLIVLAAVLVFLPLGLYFLQNWGQFTQRMGVTTYNTFGPGADSVPLALLRNLGRTLGSLSLPGFGDMIARHNLPGRPIFDVFLSLLFWLGILSLVRHRRRPSSLILGPWAGVMLLPVILTDGVPTYTRLFGAMPALAGICAVGGTTLINGLDRALASPGADIVQRLPTPVQASLPLIVLFVGLTFSLGITTYDYFVRWANDPRLFDAFHVGDWRAANLARDRLQTDTVYLVPNLIDEAHPTFNLLLDNTAVRTFAPPCLVYQDQPTRPLTYLAHTQNDQQIMPALQATYPTGRQGTRITHPLTGQTFFQAFEVPAETPAGPSSAPIAQFGNSIRLLDYDLSLSPQRPQVTQPITLTLTFTWHALASPAADHTLFLHLYRSGSEDSPPLAQRDASPCQPTGRWHEGELIRDRHTLVLPADLPADTYTLALGLYTWPSFQRLPMADSNSPLSGNRHSLAQLTIGN